MKNELGSISETLDKRKFSVTVRRKKIGKKKKGMKKGSCWERKRGGSWGSQSWCRRGTLDRRVRALKSAKKKKAQENCQKDKMQGFEGLSGGDLKGKKLARKSWGKKKGTSERRKRKRKTGWGGGRGGGLRELSLLKTGILRHDTQNGDHQFFNRNWGRGGTENKSSFGCCRGKRKFWICREEAQTSRQTVCRKEKAPAA